MLKPVRFMQRNGISILRLTVIDQKGQEIGKITDIILKPQECLIDKVIISDGGVLSKKYFTITEKDALKPLVEARLSPLEKPGIQCIRLADHGIQLRPNVLYKWFVAVITDTDRRSRDILSGGMIEVVAASPELSAKINQAPKAQLPFVLAEEGFWYDALAGVSDRIAGAPKDLPLRKQRAALLEQVGLNEAAEFDLKEARSGQ